LNVTRLFGCEREKIRIIEYLLENNANYDSPKPKGTNDCEDVKSEPACTVLYFDLVDIFPKSRGVRRDS
jgi:hypothetical protein